MLVKPARWNISPALIAPEARPLWKGLAFMAPLWGHASKGALLGPHGGPLAGANLAAGANLQWRGTPYGLGVGVSAAGDLLNQTDFAPLKTSNGAYTGDFTIITLANPKAEARQSAAFSQTSGGTATRVFILPNSGSVSGQLGFYTDTGGSAVSCHVLGLVDGKYHVFGGRRRGTTLELFSDGIVRGSATGAVQTIGGTTAGIAIGNRAEDTASDRIDPACNVVLVAAWNRALNNAEMLLLARDPFCMFRPSAEWRGVWTPLGGGNAILSPADVTGSLQFETPAISQNHILTLVDAFIAENFETPALNIGSVLNPAKSFFASIADTPTFFQNHNLPAQEMNFAFPADAAQLVMNAQGTPGFRKLGIGASSRRKNTGSDTRGVQMLMDGRSTPITE